MVSCLFVRPFETHKDANVEQAARLWGVFSESDTKLGALTPALVVSRRVAGFDTALAAAVALTEMRA